MAVRAALVGGLVAPLLAGCAGPGNPPRPSPTGGVRPPSPTAAPTLSPRLSPTADRPCGLGGGAPPRLQHVVLIVMENRSYSEIVGSPAAPYFNRLAGLCGLATDYSAVAHPSLPNYLALTSGSTQQVTDDGGP